MKRCVIHILCYFPKNIWVSLLCVILSLRVSSQTTDTSSHQLNEVVILDNKQQTFQASKKAITIDSTTLARYQTSSLTELLSNQSTIHVKSYGNGNIATTSMRGGNASQTALLWNGLNINSPGLGMYDLTLVPIMLFDNVSLEYGGGSTLWGSGAIGGAIHLNNKAVFNQGFQTKLNMSLGSFGTKKMASGILLSYKKMVSNTRVYYNVSQNNYPYKDTLDKENPNKKVINADYMMKGLMQEINFLINPSQKIGVRFWYNYAHRNLPTNFFVNNNRNQKDENLKLSADWNYNKRRLNSIIRAAYFKDKNYYNDSISRIHSKNFTNTIIIENDNTYQLKQHTFNIGVNYTLYQSQSINPTDTGDITTNSQLHKLAFFAAYKLSLLNSKFNYNLSIRKEFTSLTEIPFTGNTGIRYQLVKTLAVKINASSSYRQPTLYDLYWNPGGNPQLKSEESYDVDGGLDFKWNKNYFSVMFEATYFNRHTTNWITWQQTIYGYPSPKNIAQVYSRGTETKTELLFLKKDFHAKLILNTSYVLSTYQKSENENDNSVGRQLIFTPRYTGQASLMVSYKTFNVLFGNNYTGYRFSSSDNSTWLQPYYVANIRASYGYSYSSVSIEFFGNINNVFNKNYVVLNNYPMPLRNYEIGMAMHFKQKNKKPSNHLN